MITIFAEKFDVGLKICASLSNNFKLNSKQITMRNLESNKEELKKKYKRQGYIEIDYMGKTCVTWGQGHLVRLKNAEEYNKEYKLWSKLPKPFLPKYELTAIDGAKSQLKIIKNLFDKSDYIINATDFDREGDLIFSYVYEYLKCKTPYKRVKLVSQTEEGFKKAFSSFEDINKVKRVELAGRARSIADWDVGINLTVFKSLKEGKLFTIGRVQTPTLNIIARREREIKNFKSEKYYVVESNFIVDGKEYKGKLSENFKDIDKAKEVLKKVTGDAKVIDVKSEDEKKEPPKLYNLTGLQMDANEYFSYSSKETLNIAQKLYEQGYLTYPRTSNTYLPDDMKASVSKILDSLKTLLPEIGNCKSRKFTKRYYDTSKVESHFAIVPTNNIPSMTNLEEKERNIYLLVARNLAMSVFEPAILEKSEIETEISGFKFISKGKVIKEESFLALDKFSKKAETVLAKVKKGDIAKSQPSIKESETKPPQRYNDKTLLQAMKSAGKKKTELEDLTTESGIGTEATRANIIDGLIKKEYIKKVKKNFVPTEKGLFLIDTLEIDEIKSPTLTAQWEDKLNKIESGKEDYNSFISSIEDKTREWTSLVDQDKIMSLKCPFCGNNLIEGTGKYYCSNCELKIYKSIAKATIDYETLKDLIEKGETKELLFEKKDKTKFKTSLILKKDCYVNGKVTEKALSFKIKKSTSKKNSLDGFNFIETEKTYKKDDIFIYKTISQRDISKEEFREFYENKKRLIV